MLQLFEPKNLLKKKRMLLGYICCDTNGSAWKPSSSGTLFGPLDRLAKLTCCGSTYMYTQGGGHTSISLTLMLVREQISTTQKSRMTLNSNPQKIECPKIQTQKNRMTQDATFVEVRINMKSYYDFMFFSTVCSSCKGFKCVTQKLEDPRK